MGSIGSVGRGLVAGGIGTVAFTLAETAEMRVTGREPSNVPGQVAAKLAGRDPQDARELVERLNPVVHWFHGIALGGVRGLLDAAGLSPAAATAAFVPLVWGGDAALYYALRVAPPPWQWERSELLTDLFGKTVLAVATSLAYIALDD